MIKILLKICVFIIIFASQSLAQSADKTKSAFKAENQQTVAQTNASEGNVFLRQAPQISSSINPIYQIAKFISGDDKSNYLIINPRVSEHNYQFKASNINTLNESDVVFYVGNGLESNFPKALSSLTKKPKIVELVKSKYVKLITFQSRAGEDNIDYHIWLSPENAIGIAGQIAETLSSLYPNSALVYKKNLQRFIVDVKNMDKQIKLKLLKIKPKSFIVDHDSIAYFENYYNFPAAGVMRYYNNQELTRKDIARINNLIKSNKVICALGSVQEKNALVKQIVSNNKIKFVLTDIIGSQINYGDNGYTKIISDFVDDLEKCVSSK